MSDAWTGQRRALHTDAETVPAEHLTAFEEHLRTWHYANAPAAQWAGFTTAHLLFLHDNAFDAGTACKAGWRFPADVIFDSATQHARRTRDVSLVLELLEALHDPERRDPRASDLIDDLQIAAEADADLPLSADWQSRWDWPREFIASLHAGTPDALTRTLYRVPACIGARTTGPLSWSRWYALATATHEDLLLIDALFPVVANRSPTAVPVDAIVAWAHRHGPQVALLMDKAGLTREEGLAWSGSLDSLAVIAGLRSGT